MDRYALTLAVGVIAASAVSNASAAVLLSQDFEDRAAFVPGTVINNSTGTGNAAAVGGLWTSNNSSGQPLLTADPTDAGNQSARVHRTGGGTTALFGQRQQSDAVESGVVTFEYAVYRETVETVNVGYIVSLYNSANLSTSGPLSIYVDSSGLLHRKNPANTGWLSYPAFPVTANTWANFSGSADLDAGTWSLSLNGTSVFTDLEFHQASLINVGGVTGANGINAISFLPQPNNNSRFYVDDVVVEAVPEPTGLAFLALGSAGLMARRRR